MDLTEVESLAVILPGVLTFLFGPVHKWRIWEGQPFRDPPGTREWGWDRGPSGDRRRRKPEEEGVDEGGKGDHTCGEGALRVGTGRYSTSEVMEEEGGPRVCHPRR